MRTLVVRSNIRHRWNAQKGESEDSDQGDNNRIDGTTYCGRESRVGIWKSAINYGNFEQNTGTEEAYWRNQHANKSFGTTGKECKCNAGSAATDGKNYTQSKGKNLQTTVRLENSTSPNTGMQQGSSNVIIQGSEAIEAKNNEKEPIIAEQQIEKANNGKENKNWANLFEGNRMAAKGMNLTFITP